MYQGKAWANGPGGGTPLDAPALNDLEARIAAGLAAQAYTHTQGTASTVWTITHTLPFRPAGIVVRDQNGDLHRPLVDYPAENQIRLTFVDPVFGTADLS